MGVCDRVGGVVSFRAMRHSNKRTVSTSVPCSTVNFVALYTGYMELVHRVMACF